MFQEKIDLLIYNSKEVEAASGIFSDNVQNKVTALNATLKNKKVNRKVLEMAMEVIKKNTSMFSNFRGHNLLTIANILAFEDDMSASLKEITRIYDELKKKFGASEYLVLAALVIFNSNDKLNSEEIINKTKQTYEYMKKEHPFLTGSDDVTSATIIALTSENLEATMKDVELYYRGLNNIGYWKGNNLQALANIMPLFEGDIDIKVKKVKAVDDALKENKIAIRTETMPILGLIAGIIKDEKAFSKKCKLTSDTLQDEKGFGNFVLGQEFRNILAISIELTNEINSLEGEINQRIIDTTNNVALNIQIAIEMAITAGMVAAAAAANSGS